MKQIFNRGQYYFMVRLGKLHIYFSKYALRKRGKTLKKDSWKRKMRERKLKEQDGKCAYCGREIKHSTSTLHHIKPVSIYPELRRDAENLTLLCHSCHHAIHNKGTLVANLMLANGVIFKIPKENYIKNLIK